MPVPLIVPLTVAALNEGRRLPPATTGSRARRNAGTARGPLNEGRRLPPATTAVARAEVPTTGFAAQRRPEITPGYDQYGGTARDWRAGAAQRRPEITPGYDVSNRAQLGDASTPLNEGRRLPPATTPPARRMVAAANALAAQRRPEITPGYDRTRPAKR